MNNCVLRFFACCTFLLSTQVLLAVELDARISRDANNVVTWVVDYDTTGSPLASAFHSMQPDTGELSNAAPFGLVSFQSWFDLGDVFCPLYSDGSYGAFWDGFDGITSSDPTIGVAPDHDGNGGDDLYLAYTGVGLTGAGSFTMTIPTSSDVAASCYNPGTYVSNDGTATVIVDSTFAESSPCDFDGSGSCNVVDLDALLDALGGTDSTYDLDGNGTVDRTDRGAWLFDAGNQQIGRPYVIGDVDLDGDVESDDLNVVGLNWLSNSVTSWAQADFDGNGTINSQDLNAVALRWQHGVEETADGGINAVPEPNSMALFLAACFFVLGKPLARKIC